MKIKLNLDNCKPFYSNAEFKNIEKQASISREKLQNKSGKGNDFLGWINLPSETSNELLNDINAAAKKLSSSSEIVVVIGIGGSYLGARAIIEALGDPFEPFRKEKSNPTILYAGHHISEDYHFELLELLAMGEIKAMQGRHNSYISMFTKMGGYAPTMV